LRQAGWETELVQVGGRTIRGCRACFACYTRKNNTCVQKDIFNETFQKMLRADAIIIGSPTYASGMSSETKAMIDRSVLVAEANGDSLRSKIGAAVAVNRRSGAVNVFDSINHMFFCSQMIVPGSFYWNLGVGRDKGDVDNDAEGKATMLHLGQVIDLVATAMAPHSRKWPTKPSF
jgi:multimeric flavodoxin WrbA